MAFAISKQLREVETFLQKAQPDQHERRAEIEQLYPWIIRLLKTDHVRFLELGTTQSALVLAAKLLEISPSKVAKVVHTSRSRF
jgi:hypothetical protein